ncbi:MAG: RDD family protein [Chthoniobacter sp.]|nr:RDD family protein [Chthoniobacter sp.]
MSWYYAENNERRGPVGDADFKSLVYAGTIKPDTLVWREGFAAWMPYGSVATASPPASSDLAGAAGIAGSSAVACSQCGRLFPADETVTYEGRHVCAECKPLFFQRIKEGAPITGQSAYAGFWIRFGAKFLDNIIVGIGGQAFGLAIGAALPRSPAAPILALLVGVALNGTYITFFLGKYGATPGKMACNLRVIRTDGSPLTYGRAAARYFGEVLSKCTLFIGYLMVAFDETEKRALHDRICDTRVVRKPER